MRGLPKASRLSTYSKAAASATRAARVVPTAMDSRSWLKLVMT